MDLPQTLSLLIPVYNEADNVENVVQKLSSIPWGVPTELVFVDDGSKDGTSEILERVLKGGGFPVRVLHHKFEKNQGKGKALHKAIELAMGDILIVQDADFEYDPNDIITLIKPILEGRADVVYGSRFKKNAPQVHRTFHYFVNRVLTLWSNLLTGLYLTDMETCYKAFRADILKNINLSSPRFGFEPEITAHVARLKVRVLEFPISYFPRNYIEGKKISWKDGVAALFHIFKFNVLWKDKTRFKPGLPKRYIPAGRQWL